MSQTRWRGGQRVATHLAQVAGETGGTQTVESLEVAAALTPVSDRGRQRTRPHRPHSAPLHSHVDRDNDNR